jgi:glutaredoxin-like protein NrdH
MKFNHVAGENVGQIVLYALSTCVWCKKTRRLLEELGVDFHYVYVDLLNEKDQKEAMQEVEKWNPAGSLPTIVFNGKECVVGYDADEIRGKLGL